MMTSWLSGMVLLLTFAVGSQAAEWRSVWIPPNDSQWAAADSDEYAWRLFVALNWPAMRGTRHADPAARFGDDRPTVWESWKHLAEVYLPDGRDPGPWLDEPVGPMDQSSQRFQTLALAEFPHARHIVNGKMTPLLDPLARAKRLTEARMNAIAYNYIRARELYNIEGQINAVRAAHPVQFPAGAINVKAKWRPISEGEKSRYHTTTVTFADGSAHLYGLTALHLSSKDLPQWFWATFEHVDNASASDGEGWLLPSRDAFACRGLALTCNAAPAGIGLEGTVWQNYRLRGTLIRAVDDNKQPLLLANSELESGDQRSSSCITCHSRSALAVAKDGGGRRLTIFEGVSDTAATPVPLRRGAIGEPRPEWFLPAEADPQGRFYQLDFVWSLSQAQARRAL